MIQDDRLLHAWLLEGPDKGPVEGLTRTLVVVHRTRQRPAWSVPGRWIPWAAPMADARAGLFGLAAVIVLALVVLAVVAGLIVGSQRRLPPPVGPAGNGIMAYDTGPGGIIFVTDRDGKDAHPLVGDVDVQRAPTFSPDGTMIAFWRRPSDTPGSSVPTSDCGCPLFELWVANADGSNPRNVSRDLEIGTSPTTRPSWSPDSDRLAFGSEGEQGARLYVTDADGSTAPTPITGLDASRYNAAWSPDGDWIAFKQQTTDTPPIASVGVIRPDGTDMQTFGGQALEGDPGAFADVIVWSPDSTRFAYVRGSDPAKLDEPQFWAILETVDIGTGERTRLYKEQTGWLNLPDWSPDGSQLTFVAGEVETVLRLIRADGTQIEQLERCTKMFDNWARWSPDGKSLVAFCDGTPERIPVDDPDAAEPMDLPAGATLVDQQRVAE